MDAARISEKVSYSFPDSSVSKGKQSPVCPMGQISCFPDESYCPYDKGLSISDGCSSNTMPPGVQESGFDLHSPASMRVTSSIKRTGTNATWLYPSIEMFKAAILRKTQAKRGTEGIQRQPRTEDINSLDESTLSAIVHMHNIVNEQAWQHILKYEKLHGCKEPSLSSFHGRPNDLTIKAQLWRALGYTPPFDRHDWLVDRCGCSEKPIRYIIDFYEGQKKLSLVDGKEVQVPSIYLDVRPEPTLAGLYDRFRIFFKGLLF